MQSEATRMSENSSGLLGVCLFVLALCAFPPRKSSVYISSVIDWHIQL